MIKSSEFRKYVDTKKGELSLLQDQIQDKISDIKIREQKNEDLVKAKWLLAEAVRRSQKNVKKKIESLVTMAIQSVFPRQYKFLADFEIKRGRSECLFQVQEEDYEPYLPEYDQGGSILDIIGFALRPVMWSLENPRSRKTMIYDEPMKWVAGLAPKAAQIMKEVSHQMGMQMIIFTHDKVFIDIADKVFQVTHNGEHSEVEAIGG